MALIVSNLTRGGIQVVEFKGEKKNNEGHIQQKIVRFYTKFTVLMNKYMGF